MNFGKRTSEADSIAVMARAEELGITHFDTANAYNEGESERIVGRFVKKDRERFQVATKCGFGRVDGKAEGISKKALFAAIDGSLSRLGTDYVDLYYLHVPDHVTPYEESLTALASLLEQKKIRAWGISNFAAWQVGEMYGIARSLGMPAPNMAQHLYNVLVRQLDIEWFSFAKKNALHTTIYNPLAGGLLSGKHAKEETPKGGRFDKNAFYKGRYWTDAMFARVEQLKEVAASESMSLVELSYAWAAGTSGVDSILVGPGSLAHLDDAVSAVEKTVSPEGRKRIDALHREWLGTDTYYVR